MILNIEPRYRVYYTRNTKSSSFAPPPGYRLALTQVKIDNQEQCHCCIRIDVGKRTRFLAYLGRENKPRPEINIRLPKPIIGSPDEPMTINVSDPLPVGITVTGYEFL